MIFMYHVFYCCQYTVTLGINCGLVQSFCKLFLTTHDIVIRKANVFTPKPVKCCKGILVVQGLEGEDDAAISLLSDTTAKLTSAVR